MSTDTTTTTTTTSDSTTLTSPTDTSTSTTTTSSNTSTTSSSSTTATSSTSSSSSTSSTSSSSTSSSSSISTSTSVVVSTGTSAGNVVTLTSSVIVTPAKTQTLPTAAAAQPKGFFQNTGAVAGTFTVVGLVGLGILILAVTQTIRRRRAKRFDREIAEAAREAATAPVPVFLDDEDDNYGPGYGQVPAAYSTTNPSGGYSDVSSHGTYGQQPMSHESYPMSERSGPGPGQYYDYNMYGVPTTAGAAGIGVVRARSTKDPGGYAAALNEGNSPYPAFASTHPQYDMYNGPANMGMVQQPPMYRGPGSNEGHDGMSTGPTGGVASQYSSGSDLSRMKSNGSRSLVEGYYPSTSATTALEHPNESYASHYQPGFDPATHQLYDHPHNLQPGVVSQKDADDGDAAYGGYADHPSGGQRSPTPGLPNPFAADKGEVESEEDSGEDSGRRVLKVANT